MTSDDGEVEFADAESPEQRQFEVTVKFIGPSLEAVVQLITNQLGENAVEVARVVEVHDPIRLKSYLVENDLL